MIKTKTNSVVGIKYESVFNLENRTYVYNTFLRKPKILVSKVLHISNFHEIFEKNGNLSTQMYINLPSNTYTNSFVSLS